MENVYGYLCIGLVFFSMQADNNEGPAHNIAHVTTAYHMEQFEPKKESDEYGFEEENPFPEHVDGIAVDIPKMSPLKSYLYGLFGDFVIFSITMKLRIDEYFEKIKKMVNRWLTVKAVSGNKEVSTDKKR